MADIKAVKILKELVDEYKLLTLVDLKIHNIEDLMERRDSEIFAGRWGVVDDELAKFRNDPPGQFRYRIPIKERKIISSIEEEVYFRVYNSCADEEMLIYYDDLSAYLSEDFGLIAESLYWGYNSAWLNALFHEYTEHRIPCGELKEMEGDLCDMLMNYYKKIINDK